MKIQISSTARFFLFFLIVFGLNSCDESTQSHSASTSTTTASTKDSLKQVAPGEQATQTKPPTQAMRLPDKHQCVLAGSVLEDNAFWIKEAQTLVGISADSTTKDADFGDSHRIFTAMNTRDCSIAFQETLPINRSPDFPWYLNTNTYELTNQVLCMQGVEFVFCYDVAAQKLLPRLRATFLNKRVALDAQSGSPAGLTIWNRYLLGYSLDQGAFAFDLRNKEKIVPILPAAEYYSENDGSYHSLFLLKGESGNVQALMPTLNEDQDGMIGNKLFQQALPITTNIANNVRDNRFIVLPYQKGNTKVVIDMEEMKRISLPSDAESSSVKEILDYLKKRN